MAKERGSPPRPPAGAKLGVRLTGILVFTFLMTALFNLLILATPLFTIQLYSRVLTSQSVETLLVLTGAALIAIAFAALFDTLRQVILQRMSHRVFLDLGRQVVAASMRPNVNLPSRDLPLQDVEAIRRFVGGREILNYMDVPFTVVFLAILTFIHPAIGGISVLAALLMLTLAAIQEAVASGAQRTSFDANRQSADDIRDFGRDMYAVTAMGMTRPVVDRWLGKQIDGANEMRRSEGWTVIISGVSRFLRFGLQLLVMAIAAYFVLADGLNPGMIIASSILATRALTPIEGLISGQRLFRNARDGYRRVSGLLSGGEIGGVLPHQPERGEIELRDIVYTPPGPGRQQPLLRGLKLSVQPGEVVGIVGPSGTGKSAIGQLILGAIEPMSGAVLLSGADIRKCDRELLAPALGYLEQASELLPGTIAENVARFTGAPIEEIWKAIRAAGVEAAVNKLPLGIRTPMRDAGRDLSPGIYRRLLIARAIFGQPKIVVLDEPTKDLDQEGEESVVTVLASLREAGAAIVLISPRGGLMRTLDHLYVIKGGVLENVPRNDDTNRVTKQQQRPTGGLRLLGE